MSKKVLHLLVNAHLDPVWLWDWREGLNEGIATCRTMLKLLQEYPEFRFIRGESSIYEQLEKYDPESFAAIGELVKTGRWDIVGGNYVQSDTNLPSTATLLKQYEEGKRYFQEKFNFDVKVAWAPDSFGHSAGFPEIYAASGFKYFAFTRCVSMLPDLSKSPVFYWRGAAGSKILTLFDAISYCYCNARYDLNARLDNALKLAPQFQTRHLPLFYGLGNHGGGSSRRHIEDILAWRERHADEIEVKFSTLHGFFADCEAEEEEYQEYRGEFNFCLRGCSASAAKIKSRFRKAENAVRRAEIVTHSIANFLNAPEPDLKNQWRDLLFNTFHDILPGTSIERANLEQIEWLDQVSHQCRTLEYDAMNKLVQKLDIQVKTPAHDQPEAVPFLVFNPRPVAYEATVELECNMDYRPLDDYRNRASEVPFEVLDENGKPLFFQTLMHEHNAFMDSPWRRRILTRLALPPGGWRLITLGYTPQPEAVEAPQSRVGASENMIFNEFYQVEVNLGQCGLQVKRHGEAVFAAKGLEFALFEDRFGSWGAMDENPEGWRCTKRLSSWRVKEYKVLESGPERAALFVVLSGDTSQVRLTISLDRGIDRVRLAGHIIYQERVARLCLVMDSMTEAITYQVPGGACERTVCGDVPGGRWLKSGSYGIANSVSCSFANIPEEFFAVNLIRGCRSASSADEADHLVSERPITDYGDHHFELILTTAEAVEAEAEILELAPVQVMAWTHKGEIAPQPQSLLEVTGAQMLSWNALQSTQGGSAKIRIGAQERVFDLAPWEIIKI